MNYKNSKKPNRKKEDTHSSSIETLRRKSQLTAADEFDYQKLCRSCNGLLDCVIEVLEEDLRFTYDTHEVTPWDEIRRESRELQLTALLDVKKLTAAAKQYDFMLTPDNLYYDIHGRIYVRDRDIYEAGAVFNEEEFSRQYKALAGHTFSRKYKFQDYYDGGMDLLKEEKLLDEIGACLNTDEITAALQSEYIHYSRMHRDKYMEVVKKHYYAQKRAFIILGIIAAASLALSAYFGIWERPYEKAVIEANEAYLKSDYAEAVEAMQAVDVERMNTYQKYILAVSSVKCENFNSENQNHILNSVSLNGDEKVMEYWIYINRLETAAAEDIAMQLSSNQLLYYAYLKEKAVVENGGTLSGEEKQKRLSELESKLKPLKDEYSSLIEE